MTQMIDEDRTMGKYGYYSTDLKPKSHKKIVAVCDGCDAVRYPGKADYRDLCGSCSQKGLPPITDEARLNMQIAQKNRAPPTDEARLNMSKGQTRRLPPSYETRRKTSATLQGIPYEDWEGFVTENLYCEKFDEACRERIRSNYDYKCFLCDKPQSENITKNGKQIALAVHHYDMNKEQGCDGVQWKLVPLCMLCHSKSHSMIWTARIEYLLENYGNHAVDVTVRPYSEMLPDESMRIYAPDL